jgi:hypothetical protein
MDDGTTGWKSLPAMPPPVAAPEPEPGGLPNSGPVSVAGLGRDRRGRRRRGGWGLGWGLGWVPLAGVLVVQAVLSLRLVRADSAFQDEALYLWAGHREWAHWLHGVPVPPFPAYFSGAPVIYPPLGALADSAGGLAGARVLSLAFMLGATALCWATASRLFGRRAGFFAAALLAAAGPTLHLGAFATYDALALLLIATAAWCAVRGGQRPDSTGWMVAAGAALALGSAAAYAAALLAPAVVLLALLAAAPGPGKAAARQAATLLTVTVTLLLAGALIGGSPYLRGITQTTILRAGGADSPLAVAGSAWSWTGLIIAIAAAGAAAAWARRDARPRAWLLTLLAAAGLLAPLEQAALHSTASLNKHVEFGAWFAAIAAGYAADQFIAAAPARRAALTAGACTVALALPLSLGITQARAFATAWPNSASFIAIFGPLADHGTGRLLVEDPSIAEYYLPAGTRWQRWSSTRNIILPSGASTGGPAASITGDGNPAAFTRYIRRRYFSLVALNFADTTTLDHHIRTDLRAARYHIIQVIPYGTGTYIIYKPETTT